MRTDHSTCWGGGYPTRAVVSPHCDGRFRRHIGTHDCPCTHHRACMDGDTPEHDRLGGHPGTVLEVDRCVIELEGGRMPLVAAGAKKRTLRDAHVVSDAHRFQV